jgi:hypothetical protein
VPEEMRWKAGIWIHDDVRHNSIHGNWKHACPPYELGMEFAVVVEGNGDTNDKSIQGNGCHRSFTVTHHCQKRNGIQHQWTKTGGIGQVKCLQVGWREQLSSGPRKVKVVSNSVFNGNWDFGTTDMFLDRSPEISDLCKDLLWRASSWVTPSSLSRWRHTKMAHQLLIFSQRNRIVFCSQ